jgi:hypothetical protein
MGGLAEQLHLATADQDPGDPGRADSREPAAPFGQGEIAVAVNPGPDPERGGGHEREDGGAGGCGTDVA